MASIIRRLSRGSGSQRNSQHSQDARLSSGSQHYQNQSQPNPNTGDTPPLSAGAKMMQNGGIVTNANPVSGHSRTASGGAAVGDRSRPDSQLSNGSFDFLQRPTQASAGQPTQQTHQQPQQSVTMSQQSRPQSIPRSTIGNLSRTDQIVLMHFWEDKYADNAKRDIHFLKFPFFGQYPSHKELLPYCEIYHLVKTSPGASIISLGSASGVYIGFELEQGAQLHIDMDDEWQNISHHRVTFKPYESILRDPTSDATFKSWPKPLTIEFLEEQYQKWLHDLTSFCWADESVSELGGGTVGTNVTDEKESMAM